MKRVIIETQSNSLFMGSESEQVYDQRGGLCEVGAGHIVVTTNAYDPDYLAYWRELGFSLPELVVAGPYDSSCTITDLIGRNTSARDQIRNLVNGSWARIEPFWVEQRDTALPEILGIPMYSNVDVSAELACRFAFKEMCEHIGLPTAPWVGGDAPNQVLEAYVSSSFKDKPVLVKAANCTGGIDLGTMKYFANAEDMCKRKDELGQLRFPLVVEQVLTGITEVGVHWEIDEMGKPHFIGIFDQLAQNFSYSGAVFPTVVSTAVQKKIISDLENRFFPELVRRGGRGFFCCDVLIDSSGDMYWTDFNPRKGAILYIHRVAERLAREVFCLDNMPWHVWHQHARLPKEGVCFAELREILVPLLTPSTSQSFVVLTNPGSIPFGGIDITGFSTRSRYGSKCAVAEAQRLLDTALT